MRRTVLASLAASLSLLIAACSRAPENTAPVNTKAVLDRVVATVNSFDLYLRRYEYQEADQAMFDQFGNTIQHALNAKPRIHGTAIAIKWRKNAALIGHGDLNKNGKVEPNEPMLFKLEFDPDNDRVIVTSAAYRTAEGTNMRGSGFFTGVLIAGIVKRQVNAGMKYGHFNKRTVAGAPIGAKVADNKKGAKKGGK